MDYDNPDIPRQYISKTSYRLSSLSNKATLFRLLFHGSVAAQDRESEAGEVARRAGFEILQNESVLLEELASGLQWKSDEKCSLGKQSVRKSCIVCVYHKERCSASHNSGGIAC